jgi:hypothetical protein
MDFHNRHLTTRQGVSLVKPVITATVLTRVSSLTISSFQTINQDRKLNNICSEFDRSHVLTRSESMKRAAKVVFNGGFETLTCS